MNFYKRFMADYAKKTARLTLAQHGAYTLLLDEVYASEQPLPADHGELCRICRAMNKSEQDAVRYVADKFFPVGADGLRHNSRAGKEMAHAAPAMEAARLNGKAGGRPGREPSGGENLNPLGFQFQTQLVPNTKAPHSSDKDKEPKGSSLTAESAVPDCPHEDLIDLYAKHLPTLAQPRKSLWREGKNSAAMRCRWRWVMTAHHESGSRKGDRMASDRASAIEWFDKFFGYVSKSDFLAGKGEKWACDLGWLMASANFEKVLQGNYENKETT